MLADQSLTVVAYHYVRDLPNTRFPRIKGLHLDDFRRQIVSLAARFEMATFESALALVCGHYRPARPLCLLTFDDGLKEHYTDVLPILREAQVSACFFPATSCLEGRVAAVHKVHFLMADLEFEDYKRAFHGELERLSPATEWKADPSAVRHAYPWDTPEVGALKYLANFVLEETLRNRIVDTLFATHFGDEGRFAAGLYTSWDELREMQDAGMVIGGHSHRHQTLPSFDAAAQEADLVEAADLMRAHLRPQPTWPFAYPFGRQNQDTIEVMRKLGFACAFTVQPGTNHAGDELLTLRRFDTNQFLPGRAAADAETSWEAK